MKLFELLYHSRWGFSSFGFILFLAGGALAMIALHALFEKVAGRPLPRLLQAPIVWTAAYLTFRHVLQPPMPLFLMQIYLGIVTIGVLLFALATTPSVEESRDIIIATVLGKTPSYRAVQAAAVILFPLAGFLGTRVLITPPPIEEPVELRVYHPGPPGRIEVHGQMYDLQTAKNPFREERISL